MFCLLWLEGFFFILFVLSLDFCDVWFQVRKDRHSSRYALGLVLFDYYFLLQITPDYRDSLFTLC